VKRPWMSWLLLAALAGGLSGSAAAPAQGQGLRLKDRMTAAEFERCGLQKLTASELGALEEWFSAHGMRREAGKGAAPSESLTPGPGGGGGETVAFNTSNGKYHCAACTWAQRCTRNCVNLPLAEARARGVPCKVCGGSCR
jgi:hypothetical protein